MQKFVVITQIKKRSWGKHGLGDQNENGERFANLFATKIFVI